MRLRLAATPLVLATVAIALLGCGGGATADRSAPSELFHDPRAGLSATIPAGWHVIQGRISAVIFPRQVLAAASFPVRLNGTPRGGCNPERVLHQMPEDGALLQVIEYTPSRPGNKYEGLLSRTPPRPVRFSLANGFYASYECAGPSYHFVFKDAGRIFSAQVWMNRALVDPPTRIEVLSILDSLRFVPVEARGRAER